LNFYCYFLLVDYISSLVPHVRRVQRPSSHLNVVNTTLSGLSRSPSSEAKEDTPNTPKSEKTNSKFKGKESPNLRKKLTREKSEKLIDRFREFTAKDSIHSKSEKKIRKLNETDNSVDSVRITIVSSASHSPQSSKSNSFDVLLNSADVETTSKRRVSKDGEKSDDNLNIDVDVIELENFETFVQKDPTQIVMSFYAEKKIQAHFRVVNQILYDDIETIETEKNTASSETMHLLHLIGGLLDTPHSDMGQSQRDMAIRDQLEVLIVAQTLREDCRQLLSRRFDELNAHSDFIRVYDRISIVTEKKNNQKKPKKPKLVKEMLVTLANIFDSVARSWEIAEFFPNHPTDPSAFLFSYLLHFVGERSGLVKILKSFSFILVDPVINMLLQNTRGAFDFVLIEHEQPREIIVKVEFPLCIRTIHRITACTHPSWFGEIKFCFKIEFILDPVLYSITGISASALHETVQFISTPLLLDEQQKIVKVFEKMFSITLSSNEKKKLTSTLKKMRNRS
jgi:hypothetical protein